jgi:RNA recognition motif-containing protein
MGNKVYVANISFNSTEDDVRNHFASCGNVVDVKIITDRDSGRSRGFAFVEYENDDQAGKAIADLNETDLDGRQIMVAEAREKEKKPFVKKEYSRR